MSYIQMVFDRAVGNSLRVHGGLSLDSARLAVAEGMIAGFETFSYMKDGVSYVGTTGTTLRDAIIQVKIVSRGTPESESK